MYGPCLCQLHPFWFGAWTTGALIQGILLSGDGVISLCIFAF